MGDPTSPRLPRELERAIFELAAETHPSTVVVLLRVAHRVQEWTEPFLYRTIRVLTSPSFDAFQHVLRTKPPNFLAASVRHVLFEAREGCTEDICLEIISKCPGITHLGTTINFTGPKALEALQTLPNLTHLAAGLFDLFPPAGNAFVGTVDPAHPAFAHITHLIPLDDLHHQVTGRLICIVLSRMPSLTHIRLDQEGLAPADVEHLLSDCIRLEILLLTAETSSSITGGGYPTAEPRLVWGIRGEDRDRYSSFWNEWERAANGLEDAWALAEAIVEERSRIQTGTACNNYNEWLWFGSECVIKRIPFESGLGTSVDLGVLG
ncbi:hypothetical protein C8F01DRAFT_218339 [Mycena amicta]|nr:hypothetical protein C8F01DRAFT_218339 [Mycena amicta]